MSHTTHSRHTKCALWLGLTAHFPTNNWLSFAQFRFAFFALSIIVGLPQYIRTDLPRINAWQSITFLMYPSSLHSQYWMYFLRCITALNHFWINIASLICNRNNLRFSIIIELRQSPQRQVCLCHCVFPFIHNEPFIPYMSKISAWRFFKLHDWQCWQWDLSVIVGLQPMFFAN